MQSFKLRIADKNAKLLKEQFVDLNFDYKLFRTVKDRQKIWLDQYHYTIEKREWYDVIITVKDQKWNKNLKSYFAFLETHNFICHFEII